EPAVQHGHVDALGVHDLDALARVPPAAVQVLGVAQRVAEVLVLVHARVAEPGEPGRDADVVLNEHLLDAVGVEADARPALAHRRGEVALPQVDGLADVPVRVDHDMLAPAYEFPHGGTPLWWAHPTERPRLPASVPGSRARLGWWSGRWPGRTRRGRRTGGRVAPAGGRGRRGRAGSPGARCRPARRARPTGRAARRRRRPG